MTYYDIGQKFTEQARSIPYPEMPKKPRREECESATAFGAALERWESDTEQAKEARKEYNRLQAQCTKNFKVALAKELGLEGHEKYDVLFRLAWEEGHSSGYSEVANYADTFSELLRD